MFTRLHSFRFVAVVVAAFLMVTGLQSGASAAITRTLTISASPAVGVVGTSVTFSGKLSRSPRGTLVVIQRKSGASWVKAGSTRTVNAAGNYAVRLIRPKSIATYYYRAFSARKGNLRAATSKSVAVAALRRTFVSLSCPDTVSCDAIASKTKTTAGGSITLSGTVLPYVKGTLVTLQRKVGSSWTTVTTTTVLANGTFSRGGISPQTTTTYRASVSRTTLNAPGLSNARTVNVKPSITTTSLPAATRLNPYATTLTNVGNQAGTWSASGLPTGLTLNTATGLISGTPTSNADVGNKNVVIGFTQTSTGLSAATKTLTLHTNQATPPTITTSSFVAGKRLSTYSTQLTVAGNPAPAGVWTAAPLPAGLTLNENTGVISGTPTAVESKQVVVGFTQTSSGLSAPAKTLTLQINQADAPVITTTTLVSGTRLSSYTVQLTAQGNPAGTWSASPLPDGLTLNATTGVISGTPTTVESQQVVIGFTQTSTGLAATAKTITLQINQAVPPTITTTSLAEGSVAAPYTTTLEAQGNPAGTWTASPLPSGLTLNITTGVISGTPAIGSSGDTQVVIGFTQTSTGLAAASRTLTLRIDPGANPVISTGSLPDGTRVSPYSFQLTATGNPAGTWTASPLPAGLSLNANTGVISGTPTAIGDTEVVIGFTQTSTGLPATPKTLTLHINQAPAPVISTVELPVGNRFVGYTTTLTATGNPAGTWTAAPLPNGLVLNPSTGVISGTPSAPGDTEVIIGFTQTSTGLPAPSKTLTLHINQAPAPVISTANLPDGTRLSAYSTTLTATGNPAGTWTATPLPDGLTLNATTGVISGTPTTIGDTEVVIGFTQTSTGLPAPSKTLTLHINQAAAPVISTANLPDGTRFSSYTTTLTATGNPAGTWTASPLPAGLSLNPSTGVISGTPNGLVGDTPVEIGFTQTSTGVSATPKTLTLHVNEATPPVISTLTLPDATRYQAYSTQLAVAGNPVGVWTNTSLPAGMSFNTTTGVLSGAPRTAGDFTITFGFTQTNSGQTATPKALVLHVNQSAPVIITTELPAADVFTHYSEFMQVAPAPVGKWAFVGTGGGFPLGSNMFLNVNTGEISGTPLYGFSKNLVIKFTETSTGLSSQVTIPFQAS